MFDTYELDFGTSGIYKILNIKTQKFYIGSAKCFKKRFNSHANKLYHNKHPNKYLQNSFNKYGEEVFKVIILETIDNIDSLIPTEQEYLNKLFDNQNKCYNICPVAGSALGRKHTDETKKKISESHKGKKVSEETRKKYSINAKRNKKQHFKSGKDNPMYDKKGHLHHMYGKKHSLESKEKMSKNSKGIPNEKNGKPVIQYSKNKKEKIKIYMSCAQAQRETGICGIRSCASGKRKSAGGFFWEYVK